ncbi:hypothetical protein [Flavobacterium tegetincola]|uniref:hypothetical protein n=1 Tax=Flavobacterium tegetincola TaxID=150172 RepID=UPI00041D545D|nr:hypothetical protein [Flavobacterium tegetincola]
MLFANFGSQHVDGSLGNAAVLLFIPCRRNGSRLLLTTENPALLIFLWKNNAARKTAFALKIRYR